MGTVSVMVLTNYNCFGRGRSEMGERFSSFSKSTSNLIFKIHFEFIFMMAAPPLLIFFQYCTDMKGHINSI